MTVHFDAARWEAQMDAMEAMARAEAHCFDCGICVSVVNEDVRIKDATVHAHGGSWFVRCGPCEAKWNR